MPFVIANRVVETTTTTGTGTIDLGGATQGAQTFIDGLGTGNSTYYTIEDGVDWEVGIGTVTVGAPDTLSRDTILSSSNGGSPVNWGAGTRNVFGTLPAEKAIIANASGNVTIGSSDLSDTSITIGGTVYSNKLSIHAEGSDAIAGVTEHRHSDIAGIGAHFLFARSRGSESSESVLQADDVLGRFDALGYDGTDYEVATQIDFEIDGTPGDGDMPGRIVFKTTPAGSATATEAMRIDSNQNVGFGVSPITAWTSIITAVQYGGTGAITCDKASGAGKAFIFSQNSYDDGSANRYIATDEATRYYQFNGEHVFQIASSGSANASVVWRDILTLKNNTSAVFSGNVSIEGTTTTFNKAGTATNTALEIGWEGGNDSSSMIKFHSGATPIDFDFRILRADGANGNLELDNKGTGFIFLKQDGKTGLTIDDRGNARAPYTFAVRTPTQGAWASSIGTQTVGGDLTLSVVASSAFISHNCYHDGSIWRRTDGYSFNNPTLIEMNTSGSFYIHTMTSNASTGQAISVGDPFIVTYTGDVKIGNTFNTTDNTGFLHIPEMPGAPTNTPFGITGKHIPICFDSVGKKLYAYASGAWRSTAAFT